MTGGADDRRDEISWKVVSAIAEEEGVDPRTVAPSLQSVVDVDALDRLFRGDLASEGEVTFRFGGYAVSVYSDDTVEVTESS